MSDLRFAIRSLRSRPMFTLVAVGTLALGIAVTAAVFDLANWLALRPLPAVTGQRRLAIVDFPQGPTVSYPNLDDLRRRVSEFSGLAGQGAAVPVVVQVGGGPARLVAGTVVSADYFSVLGVPLAEGRPFTREAEAAAPGALVAVISHRMRTTAFGAQSHVVGRSITVSGLRAVVVGVTPPGFRGTELLSDEDIWVPGSALWAIAHIPSVGPPTVANRADMVFTQLIARLAPRATLQRARAQLGAAVSALIAAYPQENARWKETPPAIYAADGLSVEARGYVQRVLTLLMGAAGLVLLLATANVANLFLSRGVTRQGEVAVRRALGGSSGRLIRAQLIESLLVSVLAVAAGLVLSLWLASLFHGMTLPGRNPWLGNAGIAGLPLDWRVIGFAGLVALLAGCVIGLLSGTVSVRGDVVERLKASGSTGLVGRGQLRSTLVACQLAVSVALLVTALLLVRSVRNLSRISVGFDADRVTAFAIWPPFSGYGREQSQTILRQAVARVRSVPGVEDAALSVYVPFSSTIGDAVRRKGAAASDPVAPAVSAWVGPQYFRTMGIPLLAGRGFNESEAFMRAPRGSDAVAVISASQAKALFGSTDVVGRLVQNENGSLSYRVIGVAPDTRWAGLLPGSERPPLYQPLFSITEGGTILVRSRLPMRALRPAVERAVAAVAPSVPLFDEERLSDKVDRSVAEPRLLARTLSAFTLLAVTLAGIGLYAVVAYSVAERTREMGIRIALGARGGQVVAMVLRQGLRLGVVGLGIGVVGALWLSRIIASQLYGVSPLDATTYGLAAVLLVALAAAASAVPARRATRVDPMQALRHE